MSQRPLVGEPLALDLVDTEWVEGGEPRDLFSEPGGLAAWLREHGFHGPPSAVEEPLRESRAALRGVLERAGPRSQARLNAVLRRGSVVQSLGADGPRETLRSEAGWEPAWRAAADYLDLLRDRPDRVRRCAHPDCILYFYDTSRNGTRRWCSMDGCGNRSKAARFYERTRTASRTGDGGEQASRQ